MYCKSFPIRASKPSARLEKALLAAAVRPVDPVAGEELAARVPGCLNELSPKDTTITTVSTLAANVP